MPRSVSEIDKIIGSRLKLARQGAKLTQTDLAKAIDASFQQVQKYERGFNRISSAALVSFAKALDLPLTYFFEDLPGAPETKSKARPPNEEAFARFAKSRQAETLLRKYFNLRRSEEKKVILDLLDVMQ